MPTSLAAHGQRVHVLTTDASRRDRRVALRQAGLDVVVTGPGPWVRSREAIDALAERGYRRLYLQTGPKNAGSRAARGHARATVPDHPSPHCRRRTFRHPWWAGEYSESPAGSASAPCIWTKPADSSSRASTLPVAVAPKDGDCFRGRGSAVSGRETGGRVGTSAAKTDRIGQCTTTGPAPPGHCRGSRWRHQETLAAKGCSAFFWARTSSTVGLPATARSMASLVAW